MPTGRPLPSVAALTASLLALTASLLALLAVGCSAPSLLLTPVSNANRLDEVTVERGSREKVAVIPVEGLLINAQSPGLLTPGENPLSLFVQQLDRAAADPNVKAVVLRINSPGGTVTSSDTMYQAVERFKAKTGKPVVASCQEVAASGGYYVACAADQIVAQPTTVVGSVGVIFQTFQVDRTLDMLGVTAKAIKSRPDKDIGSPFKPLTADDAAVLQRMVDEFYARFVGVVTTNRPGIKPDDLPLVTSGQVFSGERAAALGLVDRLGLLDDAIDLARERAGAANARVVLYERPYGYRGTIYASAATPAPQASVVRLDLPDAATPLPRGFYYVWR